MKTNRTLTIATVLVALAALTTLGILRGTRTAKAQDKIPPPQPDRISFGMVGITRGQTARLNVTNAGETQGIVINYRLVDSDGLVLHRNNGQPVERTETLEPGHSTFLQINGDNLVGRDETRLNFRAEARVVAPSEGTTGPIVLTVEAIGNPTSQTEWAMGLRLNHNETLVRDAPHSKRTAR